MMIIFLKFSKRNDRRKTLYIRSSRLLLRHDGVREIGTGDEIYILRALNSYIIVVFLSRIRNNSTVKCVTSPPKKKKNQNVRPCDVIERSDATGILPTCVHARLNKIDISKNLVLTYYKI